MAGLTLDKKVLHQRMENTLSIFTALVPHLNRIPMKLSGGEKTLLALVMATLHQPKMILVDEPFTGLSPQNIIFVTENLKALNEKSGITLLIVEHRVKECSRIANRIIGLKLGRVLSETLVNTTLKSANFIRCSYKTKRNQMAVTKIFWDNPYQTELNTKVKSIENETLTLYETIAYAFSGGQQSDDGTINGYKILTAKKS